MIEINDFFKNILFSLNAVMFQLTEFPPTIPMIFIKDYIYSSFLTIPEISQIEQEKYPLYTLAEIGVPKQLTEKQYNSLCKNYQFVEKKYWPPIIKQVDYIHCENVINQLQKGVNENLKRKFKENYFKLKKQNQLIVYHNQLNLIP